MGVSGKDSEAETMLYVIEDVRGGQADLAFCSTQCLRQFLNHCVDELERLVEKDKQALRQAAARRRGQRRG